MIPKTTLSISVTYYDPKDIEEVKALSKEVSKAWKQAHIYLVGLRTVAGMIRKTKALVK